MKSRSDRNTPLVVNWRPNTGCARNVIEHFRVAFTHAFSIPNTFPWLPFVRTNITMIAVGDIEVEQFTFNFHCTHGLAQFCRNVRIAPICLSSWPDTSHVYWRLKRSGARRMVIQDLGLGQRLAPIDPKDLLRKLKADALKVNIHIVHSDQTLGRIAKTGNLTQAHLHPIRNDIKASQLTRPNRTPLVEPSPKTAPDVSCLRLHVDSRVDDFTGTAPMRGGLGAIFTHIRMTPRCRHSRARIRASDSGKRFALPGDRIDAAQVLSRPNIAPGASSCVTALHRTIAQFAPSGPARVGADEPRFARVIDPGAPRLCARTLTSIHSPSLSSLLPLTAAWIGTAKKSRTRHFEHQYHHGTTARSVIEAVTSAFSS